MSSSGAPNSSEVDNIVADLLDTIPVSTPTNSDKSDAESIPTKSHSQPPPPSAPPTLPPHSQSAIENTDSNTDSAPNSYFSAFTSYMGYGNNNANNADVDTNDNADHAADNTMLNRTVLQPIHSAVGTRSLSAIDRASVMNGNGAPPLTHVQSEPLPAESPSDSEQKDAELFTVCAATMAVSDNEQTAARDSNLFAVLDSVSVSGIDNAWTKSFNEPSADSVSLRSVTYNADHRKEVNGAPVFRLAAAQSFKTEVISDHIAMQPTSWYNQNIALDDMSTFTLIVHLQVKSLKLSFISYHCLCGEALMGYNARGTPIVRGDAAVTRLLDLVLNCDDASVRNNRLKLIPRIVEGPYPVRRVVENRPVLLGNKISQTYFRGANYFEIDAKVDESMVAASIIKLCHRFAKRIVVDMAWTIQGETVQELPERLLCTCSVHNMDFAKVGDVNSEINNCHRLRYKEKEAAEEHEEEHEEKEEEEEESKKDAEAE